MLHVTQTQHHFLKKALKHYENKNFIKKYKKHQQTKCLPQMALKNEKYRLTIQKLNGEEL